METAVLFDMDGLMFDTERLMYRARDYAGEKAGMGKAGYMTTRVMGRTNEDSVCMFEEEFGEKYNHELFWRYIREFLQDFHANHTIPVRPGLYELTAYLKEKGIPMAVASSSSRKTVEQYVGEAGLLETFDVLICGDMVERSKPAPDIYLRAAQEVGVKPEQCFVLEDSRNGALSGHNAGCRTILVPDLWQPDPEILRLVETCCESLLQVKEYLQGLSLA